MRKPSGDHSIPCGASAVKPGSVKMAGTVSGFVCAGKVAGAMEKRRQRAKIRKQKQEGTKTTPQPESVLRVGNESVYRRAPFCPRWLRSMAASKMNAIARIVMDQTLENLIRLQQLDGEIRQLRASLEATPRRIRSIETELAAHAKSIADFEKRQREEEALRRRLESDLKDQQGKIAKSRQQLNIVQKRAQATALEHQISFAEQEISRFEDSELESMERSDILERELLSARQQHAS